MFGERVRDGYRAGAVWLLPVLLVCVCAGPLGCLSLPRDPPRPVTTCLGPAASGIPAAASAAVLRGRDPEESAFLLLEENRDAFLWRLALIDSATRSIDIKTFIWENDECGRLLLKRLVDAADRGVRVRILVDDLPLSGSDAGIALLSEHPGVHIRLFNPGRIRRGVVGPLAEFGLSFRELNVRMHNKLMVADGCWGIVGGRNIGNPYFGLSETYNFRDLELLAAGPILGALGEAFDEYWNSDVAYPGEVLNRAADDAARQRLTDRLSAVLVADRLLLERTPFPVDAAGWGERFSELSEQVVYGNADYLHDAPAVSGDRGTRLAERLGKFATRPRREVFFVTPYLIPSAALSGGWRERAAGGVDVRVLTASLGANNHTVAHSHYRPYRRELLRSGVRLFEMNHRPLPGTRELADTPPVRGRFVALHVKACVADGERVFLGSMNLDPRAMAINTENVLAVESPALAAQLVDAFGRLTAPGNAWEVRLAPDGKALRWQSGDTVLTRQPARGFGQRLADFFLGFLPLESQL